MSRKIRLNFDYGLFSLVIPKKTILAQNTALSRFCQHKVILLSKHTFTCYLPFSVPWVFCVRQTHVVLSWGYFDPKTWKSPWRSPSKSSYFGKNDCFYQLFQKKQFWPKTQLWVGFANIKSFYCQNTQFWAAFVKIWRKWE